MSTINAHTAPQYTGPLLPEVDVVVIGGGIIGVCSAYYLAKLGQSVMLCEKGIVGGEQSSRNWGWVRQHGRDEAELPIMMESNRLWQGLAAEVGEDLGFRQHGILYLASTEKKLSRRETWINLAKQYELESKLLSASEVAKFTAIKNNQWCGGVLTPSDGRAEPWLAMPALARGAVKQGVCIKEHCAVRTIEQTNGQVTGVVTEHGLIKCNRAVLASGAWSSLFSGNMGIYFPQLSVRSTVVATTKVASDFKANAADEELAFRCREDGGYSLALMDLTEHMLGPKSFQYFKPFIPAMVLDWQSYKLKLKMPADFPDAWGTKTNWSEDQVSPFEKMRVLNPAPNEKAVDKIMQRARRKIPALREAEVAHSWAGMIDTMPDIVPVIDSVPSIGLNVPNGLTIASGFSGHGFGIGPGAGKLVADIVCNKPLSYELRRFRLNRFCDGSKIKLGPVF